MDKAVKEAVQKAKAHVDKQESDNRPNTFSQLYLTLAHRVKTTNYRESDNKTEYNGRFLTR